MNKVITINLNGIAYQLEENGFEALRAYLDSAARRLEGNPDKAEIIADIEQSIGDKFRALLGANKTVVVEKEVQDVIVEMGPVQGGAEADDEPSPAGSGGAAKAAAAGWPQASGAPGDAKRLYRIHEGAMIAGVCNGIAAYFGIDVAIVRIAFVFTSFFWGSGLLLYIIMAVIIPRARTSAEMAAATGIPSTAEEFIRRAREGYYGGLKTFGDKRAYREWKWKFKQEMRQHKRDFKLGVDQNVRQWAQDWRQNWGKHPHPRHDSWIAGSFLGLLITIVCIVGTCAILSLIITGSVFGIALPAGMPLWVGIVLLFLIFHIIKWPLKAARYSVYYHGGGGPRYWGGGGFCLGTVWWIAIIVTLVWFSNHHSVRAHEMLDQARHGTHQAVDSLRDWWNAP
jgi:phage shock protein PspC (stress-responsive transcriptional regulator)